MLKSLLIDNRGENACRFSWTIAARPSALGRPGGPVNRAILKTLFTDTARHYGLDPERSGLTPAPDAH